MPTEMKLHHATIRTPSQGQSPRQLVLPGVDVLAIPFSITRCAGIWWQRQRAHVNNGINPCVNISASAFTWMLLWAISTLNLSVARRYSHFKKLNLTPADKWVNILLCTTSGVPFIIENMQWHDLAQCQRQYKASLQFNQMLKVQTNNCI